MDGPQLLRAWRKSKGITQMAVAAQIGVRQSTWSEWEAGTRQPHLPHALVIESLSGGACPLSAWLTPDEQETVRRVRPAEAAA